MGKRRKTAKTGDKALYKQRETATVGHDDDDNDQIYSKVDRFHNEREEFLKLDQNEDDPESEDELQEEAVLDLAVGDESSSDDDSSVADEDSDRVPQESSSHGEASSSSDDASSEDDSDDDEMPVQDIRDWGKKKSDYYNGDTADLEIGQEKDDAFVEEEAAKEIQAARLAEMNEEDFLLSDDDDEQQQQQAADVENITAHRDISMLPLKDKRRLLNKLHPELLPLVTHFKSFADDLDDRTSVITNALLNGDKNTAQSVGATKAGLQYLLTKNLLQSCMSLNLSVYLLLKREYCTNDDIDASVIQSHPVMSRLQKLNKMIQTLESAVENKVEGLEAQMDNLVKAAELLEEGLDDEEGESGSEEEEEEEEESTSITAPKTAVALDEKDVAMVDAPTETVQSKENRKREKKAQERVLLNEARFSLRPGELLVEKSQKRKRRPAPMEDYGDGGATLYEGAASSLATTLNSIEQRSSTKKKKSAAKTESIDETEGDNDELRRGLEMMEEQLGKFSDEEDGDEDGIDSGDDGDDGKDLYDVIEKRSKTRKQLRKEMYKVAPKYPRLEEEVDGERAVSRQILKNRGLVAHKAKINRNPRVKKREQYRQALKRRKGTVRDVRTNEGHKYGGEETGIKTGLSRSRKLKS